MHPPSPTSYPEGSAVECDGWFVIAATNGSVSLPGAVDGGSLSGFGSGIFKLLERDGHVGVQLVSIA